MKNSIKFSMTLLLFLSIFGCSSTWNMKQWGALQDRTFYLDKFEFMYNHSGDEEVNKLMSDYVAELYPVQQIKDGLEKKFTIKIDTVEFDGAKKAKITNSPNFKLTKGKTDAYRLYTWEASKKNRNSLALYFYVHPSTGGLVQVIPPASYMWSVILKVNEEKTVHLGGEPILFPNAIVSKFMSTTRPGEDILRDILKDVSTIPVKMNEELAAIK
ncbi:MAG TPA: hypothetical protein PKM65_09000 [Spirochaetota bacterium]|nr:hypothetical protein [Spirochaetota bacterium]HNT12432.1 hypothetical protein [Spirochaetota bacterium]